MYRASNGVTYGTEISEPNNHLNICINKAISNKQAKYGETIPRWLLLKLKVDQVT